TVVLAGDEHAPGLHVLHRMIGPVVAGFHFDGLAADGQPQDLVTQADTEHGKLAFEEHARGRDGVIARLRVARAVGQEYAVGIELEHFFGGRLGRHQRDAAATVGHQAQDVVLDAEVVGHDVEAVLRGLAIALPQLPGAFRPVLLRLDGHHLGQVDAGHAGVAARQLDGAVGVIAREDAGALRTRLAQDAGKLAGVDVGDGHHALGCQVFGQRLTGTEVRNARGAVAHHQARGQHARRFDVFGIDASVADMRVSKRYDLAVVAGIGQNFLVAGHGRVEHYLGD